MTTFTAFICSSPDGAPELLNTLYILQNQELIPLLGAAVVSWPEGRETPRTKQALDLTGAGVLDGAFWGLLFGLLFFLPSAGTSGGTAGEVLHGIPEKFIRTAREKITPGSSALFLMAEKPVLDRVVHGFRGHTCEILSFNLSKDQEDQLRASFAP